MTYLYKYTAELLNKGETDDGKKYTYVYENIEDLFIIHSDRLPSDFQFDVSKQIRSYVESEYSREVGLITTQLIPYINL